MAWNGFGTTTAMNTPRPPAKRLLSPLAVAALLAIAPKCLVCVLAYAGLLGLGGVELCGGSASAWRGHLPLFIGIAGALLSLGFARCRQAALGKSL